MLISNAEFMSIYKRNIKTGQRIEYGFYQFLDHFIGRQRTFKILGKRRHKFYKNLSKTLQQSGEGKTVQIERRKNLTHKEFKDYYMSKGIPVVMEGAAKEWDCVKKWSLEYFKELHGKDEILMVQLMTDNLPYETITLGEVIDNIRSGGSKYYRFYPLLEQHPEHIKDFDYNWLLGFKSKISWLESFQVFIGGMGSVTGLHAAHSCNIFVQTYGQKRWILYPPYYTMVLDPDPVKNFYRNPPARTNGRPFDPFNPNYEKPYELYKYIDGLEALLEPGDVLWIPPYYWHTVQNPTDSIGVSYRWVPPLYCFKLQPLYWFLDLCARNPPIWKSYKIGKKDTNLIYLAETGRLEAYLKEKEERDRLKKEKVNQA